MHKCKVLKLTNVSESAIPIFYKRKRYTKVLFNKIFFQKMGLGPKGPRKRKAEMKFMFLKAPFPFFTNARGTQKFFSIKCFSKEWGQALCACVGPSGPPPSFGKTFN